ncbi:MAG: hypothetical protein AAF220_13660 [Pseudomonadota bacterium]
MAVYADFQGRNVAWLGVRDGPLQSAISHIDREMPEEVDNSGAAKPSYEGPEPRADSRELSVVCKQWKQQRRAHALGFPTALSRTIIGKQNPSGSLYLVVIA